jgi:hypothetical protein
MQTLSDVVELRSLVGDLGAGAELGLLCTQELLKPSYDATPKNCLTFAGTGGDGVHFGLLDLGHGVSDDSPVVMTVPMNFDRSNLVVGANIRDFLGLGIRHGYFCLEQLTYDRPHWVETLAQAHYANDLSASGIRALKAIEKAFQAKPWTAHDEHLTALQMEYGGRLLLPPLR